MPYKDRTTGLIIFGILTILLGIGAGLLGLFVAFSQSLVPQDQRMPFGQLVLATAVYAVIGIVLIVLGIGSAMARRWARALMLIFSWAWLVLGIFEMVTMAIVMPMVLANVPAPTSHSAQGAQSVQMIMTITILFIFGVLAFFFIVLPGIWTFFYYSPHVKATVEARDPTPSWTDRCPLPVLALSLWLWTSVPWMLVMPLCGMWVLPLFGLMLTGLPAAAFCFVIAGLMAVAGWLLYRVDIRGWWTLLAFLILGCISGVITFSFHSMTEMYQLMHYPQAQIDQIQKLGILNGSALVWIMVLAMLPLFGYLLWVRRYFVARNSAQL